MGGQIPHTYKPVVWCLWELFSLKMINHNEFPFSCLLLVRILNNFIVYDKLSDCAYLCRVGIDYELRAS